MGEGTDHWIETAGAGAPWSGSMVNSVWDVLMIDFKATSGFPSAACLWLNFNQKLEGKRAPWCTPFMFSPGPQSRAGKDGEWVWRDKQLISSIRLNVTKRTNKIGIEKSITAKRLLMILQRIVFLESESPLVFRYFLRACILPITLIDMKHKT